MKFDRKGRNRLAFAVLVAIAASGCGSGTKLPPDVLQAGQVDIQLPPGWKVTRDGVVAPNQAGGALAPAASSASTTIPLDMQNPTTEFFQATSSFSSCLKGRGVTFIGAPDSSNPRSPTNDPGYLKSLETCAAQSHIVQALKDFQAAQSKLTPQQIQQENQQYLLWRKCMMGRGWTIPEPKPDSQGRLFSIGAGTGSGPQIVPPAGESALDSPDIQDCVKQSQLGSAGGR